MQFNIYEQQCQKLKTLIRKSKFIETVKRYINLKSGRDKVNWICMPHSIYIQGNDFKSRNWSRYFPATVINFVSLSDQCRMLCSCSYGDLLIYRYQNNDSRFYIALLESIILSLTLIKSRLFGVKIVWICHNVDQDTSPHYKILEKYRRKILIEAADLVLVLDEALKRYLKKDKLESISFGEKKGGMTSHAVLKQIENFAQNRDIVILIASQDGLKYRSFERIPDLYVRLCQKYERVGFIVAGIDPERRFDKKIEENVLRIYESNLDERPIAGLVDYIYRENDDLSIPYTLYSAVTAGIPILTRKGSLLSEVVARENVGLDVEELVTLSVDIDCFDFERFQKMHTWDSLAKTLKRNKLIT